MSDYNGVWKRTQNVTCFQRLESFLYRLPGGLPLTTNQANIPSSQTHKHQIITYFLQVHSTFDLAMQLYANQTTPIT